MDHVRVDVHGHHAAALPEEVSQELGVVPARSDSAQGIPDIRVLRSAEPAVAAQLTDLVPYRMVSAMPAVRRDISVAVDRDDLAENLGDRVRDALGPDALCVGS
ncbi:hypothetical protein [Streptomyces flavidovirens]|uniref:Uncharacterized protein n=1 Tax=Streptomyces flavidovirens TaxID=67298 RepID=A0ABW6RL39_9ACTN